MDQLVLATVLVCLIMIGVMTRMTFGGSRGTSPNDMDQIKKLLAKFDQLEAQSQSRVYGTAGFRSDSGDMIVTDRMYPSDEWPPRLM